MKIKRRVAVKGEQSPPPPMNVLFVWREVKLQLNYKIKNNNLNQNCG
jgi:hypothetical protein